MSLAKLNARFTRLIHLDTAAIGTADGITFPNAHTAIQLALNDYVPNIGEAIVVDKDSHEIAPAAHWALLRTGVFKYSPVVLIVVDKSDYSYAIATTPILDQQGWWINYFDFSITAYGLNMECYRGLRSDIVNNFQNWVDCTFTFNGGHAQSNAGNGETWFTNCKFIDAGLWSSFTSNSAIMRIIGGSMVTASTTYCVACIGDRNMYVDSFDMSGVALPSIALAACLGAYTTDLEVKNSKLPVGAVLASVLEYGQSISYLSCHSGTFYGFNARYEFQGDVIATTAVYRDSGYTSKKGSAAQSIEFTPNTYCGQQTPLTGMKIAGYVEATGIQTFRFFIAHDFTNPLEAQDFLIKALYHDEAGNTGLGMASSEPGTGLVDLPADTVVLTTNTEAWTDPGGMTYQQIDVTLNILETGRIHFVPELRIYEAGKSAFLCPLYEAV